MRIRDGSAAVGSNANRSTCRRRKYFEATQLILPITKKEAVLIEAVRSELAAGRKVTEDLNTLIQSYLGNLKELATSPEMVCRAAFSGPTNR